MLAKFATQQLFKYLDLLESGTLKLTTPDGNTRVFEGKVRGEQASIELHDWRVIRNMMLKGDIGFAEDYRDGLWETDNLTALTTLGLTNQQALNRFVAGSAFSRKLSILSYLLRLNSLSGSRKNIHAHYDLGNDFYKLWLDPSMTYSAALFKNPNESLEQAQHHKYDRILECLNQNSGSLLEIGCGWGGFAERASARSNFDLKGITLSEAQLVYAKKRLGPNADIVLKDYRHQRGKFDHIVSIEMFEAVGERYWPTFFKQISSLLKKNGKAIIQTITMNEQGFPHYRKSGDFIRSFIFPGGMLPSPSRFRAEANQAGLNAGHEFYFGQDYARTLEHWLHAFDQNRPQVKALGFDEGFIRLWRFYLSACIAGFKTSRINVTQVELCHA